ncbi:MAG TPA: acyl carrier protein [Thermoanaerobaculia bacterium]|nr:acyl carrier protein [Thermoanaerobaculia bacterium]
MSARAVPSDAELRKTVFAALRKVAPDIDPAEISPSESLRDQTDLDSMDFLNFVVGLHGALGVEIPEADYPRLESIEGIVGYLRERLNVDAAPA